MVEEVQEYAPQAVGVLLGEKSGGLLAIDFDGPGSEEKFIEKFGRPSEELPQTITWRSGRTNRRQMAFVVDREYWPLLKPK
ncbi:MAG: bifunctional DNA primase/polymerase, partial [Vulcanococcus sp.]